MTATPRFWTREKPWLTKNKMIVLGFCVGIIMQIAIAEILFG